MEVSLSDSTSDLVFGYLAKSAPRRNEKPHIKIYQFPYFLTEIAWLQ
jgi:hypothetical protein